MTVRYASDLPRTSGVYVLEFEQPYPNGRHPRHYVGWAKNIAARVQRHHDGTSRARLVEVMRECGIRFSVSIVFVGADQAFERKLKNEGHIHRHCPHCKLEGR